MPPSNSAKSSAYTKSQTAYSIYDGLDAIRKEDVIPDDIIRKTITYMKEASAVDTTEDKRHDKLTPLLSDVLGVHIQVVVNGDKTCPDGIVEFLTATGLAATLHKEDKNETETEVPTHPRKSACHLRVVGLSRRYFCTLFPTFLTSNLSLVRKRSKRHLLSFFPHSDCGPLGCDPWGGHH
jgi:hypothetical protein